MAEAVEDAKSDPKLKKLLESGDPEAEAGRPGHHHQRRQQELRHDRLAHGLGGRAAERRQGDGQRAKSRDEQSLQHQPVRRLGRIAGRAKLRRENAP